MITWKHLASSSISVDEYLDLRDRGALSEMGQLIFRMGDQPATPSCFETSRGRSHSGERETRARELLAHSSV